MIVEFKLKEINAKMMVLRPSIPLFSDVIYKLGMKFSVFSRLWRLKYHCWDRFKFVEFFGGRVKPGHRKNVMENSRNRYNGNGQYRQENTGIGKWRHGKFRADLSRDLHCSVWLINPTICSNFPCLYFPIPVFSSLYNFLPVFPSIELTFAVANHVTREIWFLVN